MVVMKVEAFSIKEGPTESGVGEAFRRVRFLLVEPEAVGGEILPFNLLEILPKYWILILALLLPAFVLLYRKRDLALNLISRII
jgi:hypothetical protein